MLGKVKYPCQLKSQAGMEINGIVSWLLGEGAEITGDCVGMAVRHAGIFDAVTLYNPEAKQEDWEEFVLQCTLRRVPDVAQVEQWFYIHGFKM